MRLHQHIAVSAVLSGLLYVAIRSVTAAVACFAAGVLIDLDHLLDYYINYGASIRIVRFFRAFRRDVLKYVVVCLHSWELVFLVFVFSWLFEWPLVVWGIALGAAVHLLLDNIFNGHSPAAYFITYRLANGFSARRFYGEQEYAERTAAIAAEKRECEERHP